MARWTITEPTTLDFDGVVTLKATLVAGHVSVLAGKRPSVHVTDISGKPLTVSHEAGMLTVTQEVVEGMLGWLRNQRTTATVVITVPADCPATLNLVSADAVVTGLTARTTVKTASGDVTLDGLSGAVDAATVSGDVQVQGVRGSIAFNSVSGPLTLAGGRLDGLTAKTVSSRITADVALAPAAQVKIGTMVGEVALRLPATVSAEVQLTSGTGRVETDFPGLTSAARGPARSVTGRIGDGTGRLAINSVSGNVTLFSRPQNPALEEQ